MNMEAPRRRLAVLCSHLRRRDSSSSHSYSLSTPNCSSHESQLNLKDCIFCQVVCGNSPAFKIYEDDTCLCILDTSPLSRGHSLVIPKLHFCSLDATPPSVIAAMCSKIPFISDAIKKATCCDSFNLLVNNGVAAGQVIFHTHIHIIPRKARDCLWASESLRRLSLKLDEEAPQLAESIRQHLSTATKTSNGKAQSSKLAGESPD